MDRISSVVPQQCSGCSACAYVCPKQCIEMAYDDEGFLFPHIDEQKCVHCGKCISTCPTVYDIKKASPMMSYAASAKDIEKTYNSSSGGVFFELANRFISELNGFVCGCVMDSDYHIHHIITNDFSELVRIQGSKYVQSDIASCLLELGRVIKTGKPVLFSGTACQVAAVQMLFGNSESLYTVDIVCHGVTSPKAFVKYMDRYYYGLQLESFRYKNPYEISTYAFSFSGGKRVVAQKDPFYNSFMLGRSFRESCYNCKYACPKRTGDITLGDCANFRAYNSLAGRSISTVLLNSVKGSQLWGMVEDRFDAVEADFNTEVRLNHQLYSPAKRPEVREQIYHDFETLSQKQLLEKYTEHWGMKTRLKHFLITHIPYSFRMKVLKFIR